MNDREKLKRVFQRLESHHDFITRMNIACCSNCAWSEINSAHRNASNVVFWHGQDEESAFGGKGKRNMLHSGLFLAWSGDAKRIFEELTKEGFQVEWNGRQDTRIMVNTAGS